MTPFAAAIVALTLSAPGADRVLVCRPRIEGDPALARGEAMGEALKELGDRVLDYGVPCDAAAEASRAARRAGLTHAVLAVAVGRTDETGFELTVVDADGRVTAVRRFAVPPGGEVVDAISAGLSGLIAEIPRPAREAAHRRAALGVAGGGAALLVVGAVLAGVARSDAGRANAADTPEGYLGARSAWERSRGLSGAALGIGGAALAAGLVWRFGLAGGE